MSINVAFSFVNFQLEELHGASKLHIPVCRNDNIIPIYANVFTEPDNLTPCCSALDTRSEGKAKHGERHYRKRNSSALRGEFLGFQETHTIRD
jgi:hypothetical protein